MIGDSERVYLLVIIIDKKKLISEAGQGVVEYSLLIIFIAVVVLGALRLTGTSLSDLYRNVACAFNGGDGCSDNDRNELLFFDDFDGDLSAWEIGTSGKKKPKWWVEFGKLWGDYNAVILLDDFDGKDFSIRVDDVEFNNKAKVWQGITIIFRAENQDGKLTGYSFNVDKRPDGEYAYFQKVQDDKPIWPVISMMDPLPPGYDWNNPGDIRIDIQGDTFTAYIDDQVVSEGQDATFTHGQVGINTHKNTSASIDALSITSLDD
ncbi:MAG: hypothetical protein PVF83_16560 [Anaerolineales bacterium]